MRPEIESLYEAASASRHYAFLSKALVMRIIEETYPKYKRDKERVKAIKSRLHQLFGAYVGDRSHQAAGALLDTVAQDGGASIRSVSKGILELHASSRERLHALDAFHAFAFSRAPQDVPLTVLDIGCGFHPFSLPWMPGVIETYHALDIDTRTAELLNRYFALLGMKQAAQTRDILTQPFEGHVDIAFLLKVLPVMEAQYKGGAQRILDGLHADTVVVSYPVRSLSGRDKGMRGHYEAAFEGLPLSGRHIADKAVIGSELIYILRKD